MTELTDDLRATAHRLLTVQQQRAELENEERDLKARLRAALSVGDKGTIDGQQVVSIVPNRRFSPDLAEQLPEPLRKLTLVTRPDSSTAKRNLPPAVYDTLMAEVGEPKVVLA